MGSFRVTNSVEIARLGVQVWLDGVWRPDVFATERVASAGTQGTRVSLVMPSVDWDGGKYWLRGKSVSVWAGYGGALAPIFHGWITRVTGRGDGRQIEMEAMSHLWWAGGALVGDGMDAPDYLAEYRERELRDGVMTATGWTVKDILRDLFQGPGEKTWRGGGGRIASGWRSVLELGSLSVLGRAWNEFPVGDVVFQDQTLRGALDELLALVGTVSLREEFTSGGRTRLVAFELADSSAPVQTVRVARPGESVAGTNVLSVSHEESAEDVATRIVGRGARKRHVVSITTGHATAPLEKGWDEALEAAVLVNPEGTLRGQEADGDDTRAEFSEEKARVFRRYLLPEAVRRWIVEKDLGVEDASGRMIGVQVWKIPRVATFTGSAWTSTLGTEPKLLEGVELDLENWAFTLRRPAINFVGGTIDGSQNVVDTYEAAEVGITLCLAKDRLTHDTGGGGGTLDLDGVRSDGIARVVTNESFGYVAITDETWEEAWLWTEAGGWTQYTAAEVLQDDEAELREFTEAALRESGDVEATYQVTVPWWTSGYRIGQRVRIVGQDDFVWGTHQVMSVTDVLTHDHTTTFSTSSSVPAIASEILSSGGPTVGGAMAGTEAMAGGGAGGAGDGVNWGPLTRGAGAGWEEQVEAAKGTSRSWAESASAFPADYSGVARRSNAVIAGDQRQHRRDAVAARTPAEVRPDTRGAMERELDRIRKEGR